VTVSFKKDMPASLGSLVEWTAGKVKGWFSSEKPAEISNPTSAAPIANDTSKLVNTNTETRVTQDKIGPAMEPAKPAAVVAVIPGEMYKNPDGTIKQEFKNPDGSIKPVPIGSSNTVDQVSTNSAKSETKGEFTMYYDKMDRNRQHPLVVETPTGETVTGKSNSDIYKAAREQGVPIKVKVVESPTESIADKGVDAFGRGFRGLIKSISGHDPAPDNTSVVIKPVSAPAVDSPSTNKASVIVAPVAPSNAPAITPLSAVVAVKETPALKQEAALPDLPSVSAATQAAYSSYTNEVAKTQAAYSAYTNQAAKASAAYSSLTNEAAKTQASYSSLTNQAAQAKRNIDYINSQLQKK
jgi:hypothetical protein